MRLVALALGLALAGCATSSPRAAAPPAKAFHMRSYWLVLLQRGPHWTPDETPESRRLFAGHMANIRAMGAAGQLLLAGPFEADAAQRDAWAGLFLFDIPSRAEVESLLTHDPAIAAGRLVPVLLQWYGPAGITFDGRAQALAAPPTP